MLNVSPIGRNCSQAERDEFERYDHVRLCLCFPARASCCCFFSPDFDALRLDCHRSCTRNETIGFGCAAGAQDPRHHGASAAGEICRPASHLLHRSSCGPKSDLAVAFTMCVPNAQEAKSALTCSLLAGTRRVRLCAAMRIGWQSLCLLSLCHGLLQIASSTSPQRAFQRSTSSGTRPPRFVCVFASPCSTTGNLLPRTVQGGNDYEIFESELTHGHTVTSPADTRAQCLAILQQKGL
jgi:hypothetical protein